MKTGFKIHSWYTPFHMKPNIKSRHLLSWCVIGFYLIPVLFFAYYNIGLMSRSKNWSILSVGLFLTSAGSLLFIFLLSYWEQSLKNKALVQPSLSAHENKVTTLPPPRSYEIDEDFPLDQMTQPSKELSLLEALNESQNHNRLLNEEIARLQISFTEISEENKEFQCKAEKALQDLEDYKLFSEEQLKQKQLQMSNLQLMMEDQRAEMEKRQEQIQLLDTKVHDLSYEIKTLLHLNETEPAFIAADLAVIQNSEPSRQVLHDLSFELENSIETALLMKEIDQPEVHFDKPIKTANEANSLLRKCLNTAEKLIGANYNSPEALRYRELSTSHYTLDQRRLFDSLRSEEAALIIIYSPKENKIVFTNPIVKDLLGWNIEKFSLDFPSIIQEGLGSWKKALNLLTSTPEVQSRLLAKTKQGHETLLNCHLGVVSMGLFRGYIMGVLYPAT